MTAVEREKKLLVYSSCRIYWLLPIRDIRYSASYGCEISRIIGTILPSYQGSSLFTSREVGKGLRGYPQMIIVTFAKELRCGKTMIILY